MFNEKYIITVDSINSQFNTCSIAIDHVIVNEQQEIVSKIGRERRGFSPGQFDEVNAYLDNKSIDADRTAIINLLNFIWTEEVIANYLEQLPTEE